MATSDVAGVRVGHWSDRRLRTGCTVVLMPPEGAFGGCDVRGSAPGTRETDLLRPGKTVQRVHAVCLCGGSAFGLAAADGVMRYLREHDVGFKVGGVRIPIVPAAVIFDLGVGSPEAYPGPDAGYEACRDAERDGPVPQGQVGVGAGATVGKVLGQHLAVPGGFGTATITMPDGAVVSAMAVVNAVGDVVDAEGRILAGATAAGAPIDVWRALLEGREVRAGAQNTTLGVVVTDALLDPAQCQKLAELGQDGLAMAIRPVHTIADGDTVFALSTGQRKADPLRLGVTATEALRRAVERAVRRTADG